MLFTVQKALALIPDGGSIILMSSIVGSKGSAANSVYAATTSARSAVFVSAAPCGLGRSPVRR
jgi:NAD(P)-dependent dehydrogenase (short-subunit alcohol dehydrogenase family)